MYKEKNANVKQHYVQAAYLGLFNLSIIENDLKLRDKHINVTYKDGKQTSVQKVSSICCENYYMTLKNKDGTKDPTLDEMFSNIETETFYYIKNLSNQTKPLLVRDGSRLDLTNKQIMNISKYIVLTFLRSPKVRNACLLSLNKTYEIDCNIKDGEKVLNKYKIELGNYNAKRKDNISKSYQGLVFNKEYINMVEFLKKSIIIFEKTCEFGNGFITSDNPVKKLGENDTNTLNEIEKIIFPIAPFCYIKFINPNVCHDYSKHLHIFYVGKDTVDLYNSIQKEQCINATYSCYY